MSDPKDAMMKAIGFFKSGESKDVFTLVSVPVPKPGPRDLLVQVMSFATNPVDNKVRKGYKPPTEEKDEAKKVPKIVGWDAAGTVKAVGAQVANFKVGDEVYFAGVVTRQGAYAEYVSVDERIVGHKPRTLSWDEAATVPLCAITAWEALTEQMNIPIPTNANEEKTNASKSLLVIAGAGGVGSIAIQIAKKLLKIGKVIATTSRKETDEWCRAKGADTTINHREALLPQLKTAGYPNGVDYIFNCAESENNPDEVIASIGTFGKLCCITPFTKPVNIDSLFFKRATITFELMFTRPITGVEPEKQAQLLDQVAKLLDSGTLVHTMTKRFDFTLPDVIKAAELQESGKAIGKIGVTVVKQQAK